MQAPRSTTSAIGVCRLATGLFLVSMLAACGYKGPLYMPPPPAPDASLTTPPTPAALPEAEAAGQAGESPASATPSPVQLN